MVVFFPFETRRLDGRQGVVARQIPVVAAATLERAGLTCEAVRFTARRGELVAHVLLEQPLPAALVADESRRRDASRAVVGRVVFDDGSYDLGAQVVEAATGAVVATAGPDDAARSSLHLAVGSLIERLGTALGVEAGPADLPRDDEALINWLTHLDNSALPPDVFTGRDAQGRWRWALDVLRTEPSYAPAAASIRALVATLVGEGRLPDATTCAIELAAATGLPDDWSVAIARLPDRSRELVERVLRHTRTTALSADAQLQLGVAALRVGLADEATVHLAAASEHARTADRAQAYHGVALAELGRHEEARALWNGVVSRGADPAAVAIARSNLDLTATGGA